ncbi:hypothetical protein C8J56DRAFT_893220 [Mycena floridula]|nr:hypothetical protein C8J56DRAFT_893220 [Mycena floridula]
MSGSHGSLPRTRQVFTEFQVFILRSSALSLEGPVNVLYGTPNSRRLHTEICQTELKNRKIGPGKILDICSVHEVIFTAITGYGDQPGMRYFCGVILVQIIGPSEHIEGSTMVNKTEGVKSRQVTTAWQYQPDREQVPKMPNHCVSAGPVHGLRID